METEKLCGYYVDTMWITPKKTGEEIEYASKKHKCGKVIRSY
jgi:hypothetical protein